MSARPYPAVKESDAVDVGGLVLDEPVVVLTAARSGSTLLRFILDTHPVLACPPETNLVQKAVQLAATWRLLDGRRESAEAKQDEAPGFPAAGIEAARSMLEGIFAPYLARCGKQRWCDKSLGTAAVAEAFSTIYPKARYICLYRHCMDVIASGVEACPWGVAGYGFDPYVSNSPGNNAAALAHYWADYTAAALEFEEAHPNSCLRVRYEELVADPEATAARIFAFVGVPEVPGIAQTSFAVGHEQYGPADYKIWATDGISTNSVGRGVHVPIGVIPVPMRGVVNDLLDKLGYATVEEGWNQQDARSMLRSEPAGTDTLRTDPAADPELDALDTLLTSRIRTALNPSATGRGRIVFAARSVNGTVHERTWHVDLGMGLLAQRPGEDADDAWRITGDSEAWLSVLVGRTNLGVAIRRGELRCGKVPEASGLREDTCLSILTRILGLTHLPASEKIEEGQLL
jgi:hypothetical protein